MCVWMSWKVMGVLYPKPARCLQMLQLTRGSLYSMISTSAVRRVVHLTILRGRILRWEWQQAVTAIEAKRDKVALAMAGRRQQQLQERCLC